MDCPTGTITLLFTDVQGSTELWDSLGDRFGAMLEHHNRLMREMIEKHRGYEVKTEGDAFMIAFAGAANAIAFAFDIQEEIAKAPWADDGQDFRVRIGMHTGEPICQMDPTTGRMDYFGPAVNRAARISAVGHGGQTLISQSCFDAALSVIDALRGELTDLGEHRFKGLSRAEHVHQVLPHSQAGRRFPKLDTLSEIPTNLPHLATTFVGREQEWREVSELLLDPDVRLVTLSGPGGIGKTRLSLRIGNELLDKFEGGVWFCDLTEAWTNQAICSAVASALSVPLPAGQDPIDAVGSILEFRKPLVILLDNFEQVVQFAASTVGQWISRAPLVKFLITSRTTLGLSGERDYRIEPLPLPPTNGDDSLAAVGTYDVVRLFVERARAAKANFALSDDNAPDIARVCSELEGMPLAIELAAARIKLMTPAQMVKKLGQKFQLLRSSRRDLPARQQTLAGAIDWSYDLLNDWEKAALCQTCSFRGGFYIDAADDVIDLSAFPDAPFGMDAVEGLREHSLLTTSETAHGTRLRMYVAIREYAEGKLAVSMNVDERRSLEQRHAQHYIQYAEQWDQQRGTESATEAFDRLEIDAENIFAVQDRALIAGDASASARAVLAISTTMAIRGISAERVPRLQRALQAIGKNASADRQLEAKLMTALCLACQDRGEWDRAAEIADQSLVFAQSLGTERERGSALIQKGEISRLRGDLDEALASFDQAAKLFDSIGDQSAHARSIGGRGSVLWKRGRYDEAIDCFTKAAEMFERVGNTAGRARNVGGRGIILAELHDYEGAIRCYEEAESMHRMLGNQVQVAQTIGNKAIVLHQRGDYEIALECLDEAERINREQGNKANVARNIGIRGQVFESQGAFEEAAECFNEAEAIHRQLGNRSGVASNIARRGYAHLKLNQPDEAAQVLADALKIFDEIGEGHTREAFECIASLAKAEHRRENSKQASIRAREALDVAETIGLRSAGADEALTEQLHALQGLANGDSA